MVCSGTELPMTMESHLPLQKEVLIRYTLFKLYFSLVQYFFLPVKCKILRDSQRNV